MLDGLTCSQCPYQYTHCPCLLCLLHQIIPTWILTHYIMMTSFPSPPPQCLVDGDALSPALTSGWVTAVELRRERGREMEREVNNTISIHVNWPTIDPMAQINTRDC